MGSAQICTVTFKVTSVPSTTPPGDELYVAGSFNGWNARDPGSRLARQEDGSFVLSLAARPGARVAFKFTRGSWESVEAREDKEDRPDRQLLVEADGQEVLAEVVGWHDHANYLAQRPGLSGSVEVLRGFHAPQLGGPRRVWVYLPPGYEDSDRRYPVLYMQDGQNLFDPGESFSGSWHVGETLERLFEQGAGQVIVVAPDNGGPARIDEYTPWRDDEVGGGGKGAQFMDFLVQTLKPHIDASFRTLADRDSTGIAGSSLGGLISVWGGLRHPEVFSRIAGFSSSIWFDHRKLLDDVRQWGQGGGLRRAGRLRVYVDMGGEEGRTVEGAKTEVQDNVDLFYLLKELGLPDDDLKMVFDDRARHDEANWAHRFGDAFRWLFEQADGGNR